MPTPKPKTKPLNPAHSLASMFEARFLKPWHLLDRGATEFTDVIKAVASEQLGNPQDNKWGSVIYFTNPKVPAPYLLGTKEDLETLLEVYKAKTIGNLIGLRITIWVTQWKGKGVLRIKPLRPAEPGAAPAPVPSGHEAAPNDIEINIDAAAALITEEDDNDQAE